jgi:hypothetical protein
MILFENELGRHDYWYDASDVAKVLMLKDGKKILGRNKFLQCCRFWGLIMLDSNQPKQSQISLGLMRWHLVNRRYKKVGMPLWSERGIAFIKRRIETQEFQIGFTKRVEKNKYTVKLSDVC